MGVQQYETRFSEIADGIKAGPKQQRGCNDVCCYITFFVLLIAFIAMGIYGYSQGKQLSNFLTQSKVQKSQGTDSILSVFQKYGGVIVGMLILSFVLSIIYLFLVKTFPKCVVYTSLVLVLVIFIALIVLAIAYQIYGVAIGVGIAVLILCCCFYCCRDQIATGIMLLKAAGEFLTEKPSTYLVPLYTFFLSVLFLIFWVLSLMCIQYSAHQDRQANKQTTWQGVFMAYWIIYFIFMVQFLYYVQVFLVSTACSFWYYSIQQNFFCKGSKWLNLSHIGSLTFGALIVTAIKVIRMLSQSARRDQQRQGNICVCVVLCLISCCLKILEDLFKTLNQNAMIVMSVTGESYWDSAKTAMSIIFNNIALFNIIDIIEFIVIFFGIFIAAGLPALLALIIVRFNYGVVNYQLAIVTLVVLFLSILIVVFFVGLLGLAVNCVFIFYCMDKRFKNMGINVLNAPPTIASLFDEQHLAGPVPPSSTQLRNIHRHEANQPQLNQNMQHPPYHPNNNPYANNQYGQPNNPYGQPNNQYAQPIKTVPSFYQYQNNQAGSFGIQ